MLPLFHAVVKFCSTNRLFNEFFVELCLFTMYFNSICIPFRPQLLQALIGFFELPEDDSIPDDEHFIDIEETPGLHIFMFFIHIK